MIGLSSRFFLLYGLVMGPAAPPPNVVGVVGVLASLLRSSLSLRCLMWQVFIGGGQYYDSDTGYWLQRSDVYMVDLGISSPAWRK